VSTIEADGQTNGSVTERLRIALLDIQVKDEEVSWLVYEDWGAGSDIDRRDSAQLGLTELRKDALNLLANLLRHHSDMDQVDKVSDKLYLQLLSVVGQELFSLLFTSGLRTEVASALSKLNAGKLDLLRIKLWFSGEHEEWLASLPWEYVRTPPGDPDFNRAGVFLSQHTELVLSRRLHVNTLRKLGEDERPLQVLIVCPNPTRQEPGAQNNGETPEQLDYVDPGKVVEKLQELERRGLVELDWLADIDPPRDAQELAERDGEYEWVTRERVIERMGRAPQPVIVHFMGHGRSNRGHGELLFAQNGGFQDWVDDDTFADIMGRSPTLKLVVLQACESALPDLYVSFSGVARRLASWGLPGVVAMQYRIKAKLATAFTDSFYDVLLGENSAIDVAVEVGRKAIQRVHDPRDRLAFGLPVVYLTGHKGIAASGSAHSLAVNRRDEAERITCPRCAVTLLASAGRCRNCGLKFRCFNPDCETKPPYEDPVNDNWCTDCGEPPNQPQWEPDTVSTVDIAAAVPASATAALSVMRPGR
jgi:hypothetical protein